jgi:hypothetical protein
MRLVSTRPRRALVAVLIAVTALAAWSVAPAAAGTTSGVAAIDCATFNSLDNLTTSAARGDDAREPESSESPIEVPADAKKGGPNFRATVPVWFHVVHDGPTAKLTRRQVEDQIMVLNMTFGGFESGGAANTGFKFDLVGVTYTDNGAWLRHGYGDKTERDMKQALRRGGWDTLNIFSTEASYYLGWAYFPGLPESRQYLDGVVVDWESWVGTSSRYEGRYDLGKTGTHEVGHWLGLYHVFQGGCNNWGDYVTDTPPQWVATRGCPEGQDSCREPGIDSIHNYMDYSYDSCYYEFTAGQAARMQEQWLYFRANG